jgi:hypothetical protein
LKLCVEIDNGGEATQNSTMGNERTDPKAITNTNPDAIQSESKQVGA